MTQDQQSGPAGWAPAAWQAVPATGPGGGPHGRPAGSASDAGTTQGRRRFVLALVAVAGVLAGAVGAAFLVAAAFISAAEDIGRGMSQGLGVEFGRSVATGVGQPYGEPGGRAPVQRFDAVAPGDLGPDPVLDAYAATCFAGELQACDDLLYESPPLSDYEEYASTCGGRVKAYDVLACVELG